MYWSNLPRIGGAHPDAWAATAICADEHDTGRQELQQVWSWRDR
jgi:hypothetical protein